MSLPPLSALGFLILFTLLPIPSGHSIQPNPNPYQVSIVKKAVPNKAKQVFHARAFFPFEIEAVWNVATHFPPFKGIVREVKKVIVLETQKDLSLVEVVVDLPSLLPTITNVLEVRYDSEKKKELSWKMIRGTRTKTNEGVVTFSTQKEGTSVEMVFELQAGAWIPQFLVDKEIKKMIPKVFKKLGKRFEVEHHRLRRLQKVAVSPSPSSFSDARP